MQLDDAIHRESIIETATGRQVLPFSDNEAFPLQRSPKVENTFEVFTAFNDALESLITAYQKYKSVAWSMLRVRATSA